MRAKDKAALVPVWYWWLWAPPLVAIGAARDSHNPVVLAITIPLAVLVMAVLTGAMIPEVRRRVKVYSAPQTDGRVAAAIFGMIVLVDVVIVSIAASLAANHIHYPGTIGCAGGAAVLVLFGVDHAAALAFLFVYHLTQLLPTIALGATMLALTSRSALMRLGAPVRKAGRRPIVR